MINNYNLNSIIVIKNKLFNLNTTFYKNIGKNDFSHICKQLLIVIRDTI